VDSTKSKLRTLVQALRDERETLKNLNILISSAIWDLKKMKESLTFF